MIDCRFLKYTTRSSVRIVWVWEPLSPVCKITAWCEITVGIKYLGMPTAKSATKPDLRLLVSYRNLRPRSELHNFKRCSTKDHLFCKIGWRVTMLLNSIRGSLSVNIFFGLELRSRRLLSQGTDSYRNCLIEHHCRRRRRYRSFSYYIRN